MRSKVFQLIAEKARAMPDVLTGIYLLLISLFMLISLLIFVCFILGSFLVNRISTLILFDSGDTRYFVSLALSKRFIEALGELDYTLEVEIANDRSISVSRAHRDYVLEIFGEQNSIDLVPIPLCGNKVIIWMDFLNTSGDVIDCEHQMLCIRTSGGGELVV